MHKNLKENLFNLLLKFTEKVNNLSYGNLASLKIGALQSNLMAYSLNMFPSLIKKMNFNVELIKIMKMVITISGNYLP